MPTQPWEQALNARSTTQLLSTTADEDVVHIIYYYTFRRSHISAKPLFSPFFGSSKFKFNALMGICCISGDREERKEDDGHQ
jgi:hypothetical protein